MVRTGALHNAEQANHGAVPTTPIAPDRTRVSYTPALPVCSVLLLPGWPMEDDGAQFKTSMGAYAIGIADHQAWDSNILLRLRITEDSKIQVRVAGLPEYEIRRTQFGIYRDHRLQVRIRERTLGVFVDDIVVYHGPLLEDPAKRQLGLDLYTRDLNGQWSDLHWRGEPSSQELPVPPANTERPKAPPIGADNFF